MSRANTPIHTHTFPNGLTLLVEEMPGVATAGMTWLLPAGAAVEPTNQQGIGAVLEEMLFRGAGDLDARAHADALDERGVHRGASVHTHHFRISATFLGDRAAAAMPLLFDIVRRPHLNEPDLAPAVELAQQAIESLEDEPQEKALEELRLLHLGEPLGRSHMGRPESLRAITPADVRSFVADRFVPGGSILALAGAVEFAPTRDAVAALLGDMRGSAPIPGGSPVRAGGLHHRHADSTQQHIALAAETVGETDPRSVLQRVAVAVLSGGMSGRLFTEVREVRGLCYAVYASYSARRDAGTIYAYAGTTTARAAETLRVLTHELNRIRDGVKTDEFQRAVVGLKSRLVMQGESTSARAHAIAADQFLVGRPRTLAERAAQIDAVTLDALNGFLRENTPESWTTLTLGPEPVPGTNA